MPKKIISIDGCLTGILTTPEHIDFKIPLILFLHGFGTDKNEVGDTFTIAADKLCKEGIGSLRIDFRGFGESKGETSDLTIEKLMHDANLAIDYILKQDFVDTRRFGICGFSLGAGISVLLSQKRGDSIKSMALLSPAGNLPEDFTGYFGFDKFSQLEKSEDVLELDLGWRKIKLKNQFIQSLKRFFLMESISSYKGAFFVIAGKDDFSCKHATDYMAKVGSQHKKSIILDHNDHVFNAFDEEKSSINKVTTEVTSWFKSTL